MTTLLEQGIIAIRSGNKGQAKSLFKQVLQADDRNERAWLWLSEVAETTEERVACVERALELNPNNSMAQLALKKLKSQVTQQTLANFLAKPSTNNSLVDTKPRKPFRLGKMSSASKHSATTTAMPIPPDGVPFKVGSAYSQNTNGFAVHHQSTQAMPAYVDDQGVHHQATQAMPISSTSVSNGNGLNGSTNGNGAKHPSSDELDKTNALPLIPILVFGSLMFTAAGGVGILLALLIFY